MTAGPIVPDYSGANLCRVVPALLGRAEGVPDWMPAVVAGARQVVLLVLDGLGWYQLQERGALAPTLTAMAGGPISSVVPTTTACALTSLTLGRPPAAHGVLGYRVRVEVDGGEDVLNVLRWRIDHGDARRAVDPDRFRTVPAFAGQPVPVVTKAEFAGSGFTHAHLAGASLVGWWVASSIAVEVRRALAEGAPLVYAYYEGIDRIAHARGFGEHYDAELAVADRLVADVVAALPSGAVLVVTSDHGQVEVGGRVIDLHPDVRSACRLVSGEGRFMWLHAPGGEGSVAVEELAAVARSRHGDRAWVRTREEIIDEGWLGGDPGPAADRLGDVALVARDPVAFRDPGDPGADRLVCRHGSVTPAELDVPLLATGAVV